MKARGRDRVRRSGRARRHDATTASAAASRSTRICCCVNKASTVVGSSSTSTAGHAAIAIAIASDAAGPRQLVRYRRTKSSDTGSRTDDALRRSARDGRRTAMREQLMVEHAGGTWRVQGTAVLGPQSNVLPRQPPRRRRPRQDPVPSRKHTPLMVAQHLAWQSSARASVSCRCPTHRSRDHPAARRHRDVVHEGCAVDTAESGAARPHAPPDGVNHRPETTRSADG